METVVKERLVGAVVLVGLIVALVPEMLSGPRREADTRQAADGSVRTYTIDLDPASGLPAETPSAQAVAEAPPETPSVPEPAAPEPAASSEARTPGPGTLEPGPSDSGPSREAPPREPPPRAATRQPAAEQTPAVDSGWVVQLGSFASRDNAERLAADVRKGGYRAFVSRFESGRSVRYRVRVGPERERAQAEALARRLQRDGRQVSIVAHP